MAGLLHPAPLWADETKSLPRRIFDPVFDVLIVRPLGLVVAVVGVSMFPPVAVLSSPGGLDPLREALDHFVIVPGEYVFTRSLGDL